MKKVFGIGLLTACVAFSAQAADFLKVTSADFRGNEPIALTHVFNGFGCTGENHSPQIAWENVPEGTKSFAVTVYDPDAPTGSGWWHWVVVNIPANVTSLPANASAQGLPEGALQTRNDYGVETYGGPCPPEGDKPHRYIVNVHALKVEKLEVNKDTPAAQVGYNIYANTLEKASLMAKFGR